MVNFSVEDLEGEDFKIFVNIKMLEDRWKDLPGFVLPRVYVDHVETVKNFPVFEDDVWMVCYPKTGSTWTQEMVWLLNNNMDFERARTELNSKVRFPLYE